MSDALVQVTVAVPGKPIVGYKIKVSNVYGTIVRSADSDALFLRAIMLGLRNTFGGSVGVESIYHDRNERPPHEDPVQVDVIDPPVRKVGRPRIVR